MKTSKLPLIPDTTTLFRKAAISITAAMLSLLLASCQDGDTQANHGEAQHQCPGPPEVTVCHLAEFANRTGVDLTDIGFEPEDVLYRHAAQVNMLLLQRAEDDWRKANPSCPFLGVRMVRSGDSPPCPDRDDFTDQQMQGLRAAQAFHQGAPLWWQALPDCPCREGDLPESWSGGAANQTYHPGAANCYRSPSLTDEEVAAAGLPPELNPGQQCCYDRNGDLITHGAGAGTPDMNGPGGVGTLVGHSYLDVETFNLLGWELYTMYWPPNKDSCPENP